MGQIRFGDLNILLVKIIMFINRWEYSVFNFVKIEIVIAYLRRGCTNLDIVIERFIEHTRDHV